MKAIHRKYLNELRQITNDLGGVLDGTSTSEVKLRDRQRAHMSVSKILYAILADHPENDNREIEWEVAAEEIEKLRELVKKQYKDRNG